MMSKFHNSLKQNYSKIPVSVRAAIWFTVCNALTQGVSFLTMPMYTRIMPDEQYGIVTTYNSWFGILLSIIALNIYGSTLNTALVKYKDRKEELLSSGFGLFILLSLVSLGLSILVAPFSEKLFMISPSLLLAIPLNIAITSCFTYWTQYEKFEYNYIILVRVTFVYVLIPAIVSVCSVWFWPIENQKAIVKVWSQLVASSPLAILLVVSAWRERHTIVDYDIWRYLLLFSIPLLPHYLSMTVLNQSDRIMIANMSGKAEAAYYAVSYQVAMATSIVINAVTQAVVPWLYRIMDTSEDAEAVGPVTTTISLFIALVNFVLTALAPEIISFFAPDSYHDAMYLIPAISGSAYFIYLYNMCVNIELFYSKRAYTVIITTISAALNIGLNFLLIPRFGYQVAAYTTLICYGLMGVGHTVACHKICKNNRLMLYRFDMFWVIGIILIAMNQSLLFTYGNTILRMAILLFITCIIYVKKDIFIDIIRIIKR